MRFCFALKNKLRLGGGLLAGWLFFLPPTIAQAGGETLAVPLPAPSATDWSYEATNHIGQWIWETNAYAKQTVRFWKAFEIPRGAKVASAILRITVDNGYSLFLDGREIGRGSDWKTVTKYDVTRLLNPGTHCLAVEGFNDRLEAGFVFALHIELLDQRSIHIVSDHSWLIVPPTKPNWVELKTAQADWRPAIIIGPIHSHPWEVWPFGLTTEPPLQPLLVHFWQRGWFQLTLSITATAAVLFCLWLLTQLAAQARSQKILQQERVRIARDIHDDLGAQLTQLLLLGEVAQREQPEHSLARGQFTQICDHARELAHALDEVVWAINARRDTVRDFTSYVCKYAQLYLGATSIRCRLDVEDDMPAVDFDLPVRRNLFLAVKEALNNAAKHSSADELFLRIARAGKKLAVTVEDNGRGFDLQEASADRNGLTNMAQRMAEIGGTCAVSSQPGAGCMVVFTVPLEERPRRWFRRAAPNELAVPPLDELN